MKEKRLKQLLDEYAAIPRTDRDKDLAKRQEKADVVLSPASAEPTRRRFKLRYLAAGLSFAIVAAIAIPMAVVLPGKMAEDARVECVVDMAANPNGSDHNDKAHIGTADDSTEGDSTPNGSAGSDDSPSTASVPSNNPSQYIVREDSVGFDWVKDLAQSVQSFSDISEDNVVVYYNSDNEVITVSDGELKQSGWFAVDDRHKIVLSTNGAYGLTAEDFNNAYGKWREMSLLPLVDGLWYNEEQQEAGFYVVSFAPQNYDYELVLCAYAGYAGKAYCEDLPIATTWRDVQVGYSVQNENAYEICFVKDGMYYCIRVTREDVDSVGAILDSIFK